jgi:hypothetical protein
MPSPLESSLKRQFTPIDGRVIKVSVELPGRVVTFENLAITVQGTKFTNAIKGDCTISIANMTKDKSDYILREGTPFNVARRVTQTGVLKRKSVSVLVGRDSTGTTLIYKGDIMFATVSDGPDKVLTIQAKTGIFNAGNIVAVTETDSSPVSRIASKIAESLGLTLDFGATDKSVANYSFTGASLKQVDKLNEHGEYNAFVDGDVLHVIDSNSTVRGRIRTLNAENGMIGIPKATERGVQVTMLWDSQTAIGGLLDITSTRYPSANGRYKIYKLSYSLSNRDVPFYYIADCQRLET